MNASIAPLVGLLLVVTLNHAYSQNPTPSLGTTRVPIPTGAATKSGKDSDPAAIELLKKPAPPEPKYLPEPANPKKEKSLKLEERAPGFAQTFQRNEKRNNDLLARQQEAIRKFNEAKDVYGRDNDPSTHPLSDFEDGAWWSKMRAKEIDPDVAEGRKERRASGDLQFNPNTKKFERATDDVPALPSQKKEKVFNPVTKKFE